MSVKNKYLSSVCLAIVVLGLSGCYVNTKPDHPQVRESFSERRSPRDNQLASSGALADVSNSSSFKPIDKVTLDGKAQSSSKAQGSGIISGIFGGGKDQSQSSSSESSAESNEDFFTRLSKRLFGAVTVEETTKVALNKFEPIENHMHYSSEGSSDSSYSFYELGDEVATAHKASFVVAKASPAPTPPAPPAPPAAVVQATPPAAASVVIPQPPVAANTNAQKIAEEKKIEATPTYGTAPTAAPTTPVEATVKAAPIAPVASAPEKAMVEVPAVPSDAEMKAKAAETHTQPEFKDVPSKESVATPAAHEEAKPKKEVKKKAKKKAAKKKPRYADTKYRDPINAVSPEDYRPQDPKATIEIQNGKHVYTGTLGELGHCDHHATEEHNY